MSTISVSQKLRALHSEPQGMASWEKDAMHRAHADSCHGLKPRLLSLRQVELVITIFQRIYHA